MTRSSSNAELREEFDESLGSGGTGESSITRRLGCLRLSPNSRRLFLNRRTFSEILRTTAPGRLYSCDSSTL